jgi:Tfp pilus assembly protein PilZ
MAEPEREVELYYDTSELFLESFQDRDGRSELFVPAPMNEEPPDVGKVGALVAAHVHLADKGVSMRVVVRVAWRRARGNTRLPAGLGLSFVDGEGGGREKLLAIARGEQAEWFDRRAPRYKLRLPVRITLPGGRFEGHDPIDLSTSGMKVSIAKPPDVGTRVEAVLPSPSAVPCLSLRLAAQVVWAHPAGDPPTMGLEFDIDERTRAALARLIVKLRKAQGEAGAPVPESKPE